MFNYKNMLDCYYLLLGVFQCSIKSIIDYNKDLFAAFNSENTEDGVFDFEFLISDCGLVKQRA